MGSRHANIIRLARLATTSLLLSILVLWLSGPAPLAGIFVSIRLH